MWQVSAAESQTNVYDGTLNTSIEVTSAQFVFGSIENVLLALPAEHLWNNSQIHLQCIVPNMLVADQKLPQLQCRQPNCCHEGTVC